MAVYRIIDHGEEPLVLPGPGGDDLIQERYAVSVEAAVGDRKCLPEKYPDMGSAVVEMARLNREWRSRDGGP
jgi:hypothetical protein